MASGLEIKLPEYSADVESWLTLVEAYLGTVPKASDAEKYGALVRALPTYIVHKLEHILTDPPSSNKYEALKTALQQTLRKQTDEECLSQLTSMQLDDRSPSELLQEMQRMNRARDVKLPEEVIKSLHLQKMPPQLQALIDTIGIDKDMDEYSKLADRIVHRHQESQKLIQETPTPADARKILELESQIRDLKRQLRDQANQGRSKRGRFFNQEQEEF